MLHRSMRTLALFVALGLGLAVTSHALAARPNTYGWSELASPSGHFLVHYEEPSATAADAQAAAANLDAAYATEVDGWGFNAPLSGQTDVYIEPTGSHLAEAYPDDPSARTTSGYLVLNPSSAHDAGTAAHELFHLIQYATYAHGANFLLEGTAEWAAANVTGNTGWLLSWFSAPEESLECLPGSTCAPPGGPDRSYSRWIFFEHLSERYGRGVVAAILERAGALGAGDDAGLDLQAIEDVLAAHGSSLAQEWNAFAGAAAADAFAFPALAASHVGPRAAVTTYTGVSNGALPTAAIAVNHLAARYVSFLSGAGGPSRAGCSAATLNIQVTVPSLALSQPALAGAGGLRQLTLDRGTASISVPWTTCSGASALVALPNASRTVDGATFTLHAQLSVARRAVAAPRIRLRMRRRAVLARGLPLRFTVVASRSGTLAVRLNPGHVSARFKLHRNLNRLALRLPRRIRAGRRALAMTAYSTTGARGATLRRRLVIRFRPAAGKGRGHST